MLDEADKRTAIEMVYRHPLVWLTTKRDEERMGRIVDHVWGTCRRTVLDGQFDPEPRKAFESLCIANLAATADYEDTVSFIPVWIFAIILKLIVSLLIDYFFSHEK